MANVKITDLPAATAATGADVVPIVQSGTTKKLSFTSLLASPTLFGSGVSTFLATPSSANLRAAVTDETGTGSLVFATSPTLVTPTLGAATATSINKVALTAPATSATLTIADGKTLTASNSLTLAGTDATTMTFPTTSATVARTDAGQTFTGAQIISTNASGALTPAGIGGTTVLHLHGTDASAARQMISGYGAGTGLDFRRANGTAASPTAVTTNNVIGGITASGYGTSAYASAFRSAVILYAGETWTNTAQGTFLTFTITPLGGTATTEVARIESNGRLQVGNAVSLNGPALTTTAPADFCSVNASTYVDNTTAASGTAAHGTANSFGAKAIAATNAGVTYTNASTIYVHGAPTAGSNVTITNPWAMYVAGGKSYFGADVSVGTGNLSFTGTAQRITGDMSNATVANRLAFQTSTTNGNTVVQAVPNGTSTTSAFTAFNNPDPTNAAAVQIVCTNAEASLRSNVTGTGTALPMTFLTGGSERVRIDTSGNVGIGVTPSYKLDVYSASGDSVAALRSAASGAGLLRLIGPDSTFAAFNAIISTQSSGSEHWYVGGNGVANTLVFKTNGGSERMRIDSSGNVGIGTASPSYTLDINAASGTFRVRNATGGNDVAITNIAGPVSLIGSTGATAIAFGTNATERMRIDTSGNVGIGVSLSLSSGYGAGPGVNFPNQSALLWRNNAGTWNTTTAGGAITYFSDNNLYIDAKDSTSAIIFRVNGANERMRIASTGSIVAGVGALATTATDGFLYVPTCAGTPTGTPTAITGMAPIVVNTTNNKLYFYSGGAWRDAGP